MGCLAREFSHGFLPELIYSYPNIYMYILIFFIHYNVLNYQAGYVVVFPVIPCLRKAISSGQNLCMKSKTLFPLLLSGNTILILGDKDHCNQIETGSHLNNNGKEKPHFASLRENCEWYMHEKENTHIDYIYRLMVTIDYKYSATLLKLCTRESN